MKRGCLPTSGLRNAAGGFNARRMTWTKPLKMTNSCSIVILYFWDNCIRSARDDVDDAGSFKIWLSLTKQSGSDEFFWRIRPSRGVFYAREVSVLLPRVMHCILSTSAHTKWSLSVRSSRRMDLDRNDGPAWQRRIPTKSARDTVVRLYLFFDKVRVERKRRACCRWGYEIQKPEQIYDLPSLVAQHMSILLSLVVKQRW